MSTATTDAPVGRRGVVAGGHPATARAGADILEAGGNAADAAVAAIAASLTAEACLTGLGAGGFALIREPNGRAELLDFFVAAPGLGRSAADRESRSHLHPYEVPFRSATQIFNVGPSSCAVPGMPLGLTTLHARHGRLPLTEVLAPAIECARHGITLVPQQDYLHDILAGILTVDDAIRAVFAPGGRLLRQGETLRFPDLGDALEALAAQGSEPFISGRYARRMVEFLDERGGLLTTEDLAAYRVIVRRPHSVRYRDRTILTNPLPSSGGTLIAHTLGLLDTRDLQIMTPQARARALADAMSATARDRVSVLADPGNTTHVCAIDAAGLAVSVTSSCGSGSGVVVEGSGIYMNNMMGEEDLNPGGYFSLSPGERLTSMMSPTIAVSRGVDGGGSGSARAGDSGDLVALGSAGSERLRSAIVQILVNMIDLDMAPQEAIDQPRLHYHREVLHAEGGTPDTVAAALAAAGYGVNRWPVRDMFFGGAQVAKRRVARAVDHGETGTTFEGGGDPRRGGTAIVV
ncbi:MAG: gamma-glutamyltransferase [Thermoleophilia bacterium]